MSILNRKKLNHLLQAIPSHGIILPDWLKEQNISPSLTAKYLTNGWLTALGHGAYIRTGLQPSWYGCINALQKQNKLNIHIGAMSAITLQGASHFIEQSTSRLFIFQDSVNQHIPKWFTRQNWPFRIISINANFLPPALGLETYEIDNTPIVISSLERAILECLYMSPQHVSIEDTFLALENLISLRPNLLNQLLGSCTSIKVKRLFLYLSEQLNYEWFSKLTLEKFSLGSGKRSIVKNGVYIPQYKITIPRALKP